MRTVIPWAAAVTSMLLVACSREPIQLHNELSWNAASLQRAPACRFSLVSVIDRTDNADHLGAVGGAPVLGSDVQGWVRAAFEQIPGYSTQAQGLSVDVEIAHAYMHSLSVSKAANVVVSVSYLRSTQIAVTRVYRGADTSMNWFDSDSEMQSAFNRALKDMARQVAQDLSTFCPSANPSGN